MGNLERNVAADYIGRVCNKTNIYIHIYIYIYIYMHKSFCLKCIENKDRHRPKLQIPTETQIAKNLSMAKTKVLEQEGEQICPAQEEEE